MPLPEPVPPRRDVGAGRRAVLAAEQGQAGGGNRVHAEVPPRVEYSLTERGRTLEPVLLALKAWGDARGGVEPPSEAPLAA